MHNYFDFSKNDNKVFIPKARHKKKISCVFDKFHKSTIHSQGLDQYAKFCEEQDKDKK